MKKKLAIVSIIILILGLVGCASNKTEVKSQATSSLSSSSTDTKKVESKKETNTQTIDGLTLTVTSKIGTIKGDRTKDNVMDSNGEYAVIENNVEKASDYKNIIIYIDVKNDTEKVVKVGKPNWIIKLQDDYGLKIFINGTEKDDQIQAKTTGKYELIYPVKNEIKTDSLKLQYSWVKNQEEFAKILNDPNVAKMDHDKAAEKYKDIFRAINLETPIQK